MAWTRGCVVLLALGVVACDPLVPLGETSGGTGSSTGSVSSSATSGPSSMTSPVPPNPTSPTTSPPTGCAPGTYMECTCPGGGYGEQICGSDGMYGSCECYGGDITWGSSGSSGGWWGSSGSSGWWGSSGSSGSGGGWTDPRIPELPPGEDCLPLDLPCAGTFDVMQDEHLQAIGICSRINGDLFIQDVSTLQPLGCLREVEGFIGIAQTPVTNLSDLAALQYADGFGLAGNAQLTTIDIPTLETVGELIVFDHAVLVSFDLPNLGEIIGNVDIFDNEMLPGCEIQELLTQTNPTTVYCEGNLADMCVDVCD